MSDLERLAALVMLVSSGIWAGIVLCYAVERVNLWQRMPVAQYAVDFRRSVHRVDPLQPIIAIIAIIGAAAFAMEAGGSASVLAWIGVVLVAGVIVFSIALPERINSQFRKRPEGDAPADADTLRSRWRLYHYLRTVPTLGAFVLLVVASTLA
ncbi:anthrone oxygenase family protein [Microbacterium sp.]|uniref:anthrone oxygenase family protein n=1 Tax=Microbacterium sp. TaxID=51671 RepID=UPI003564008B